MQYCLLLLALDSCAGPDPAQVDLDLKSTMASRVAAEHNALKADFEQSLTDTSEREDRREAVIRQIQARDGSIAFRWGLL